MDGKVQVHSRYSKLRPFTRTQDSQRRWIDRRTFSYRLAYYGQILQRPLFVQQSPFHCRRGSRTHGLSWLPRKRNPWAINPVIWLAKRSVHLWRSIELRMFGSGNHAPSRVRLRTHFLVWDRFPDVFPASPRGLSDGFWITLYIWYWASCLSTWYL